MGVLTMDTYKLTIVREAGKHPITGVLMPEARETLTIEASSQRDAYALSAVYQTIRFQGMKRRVLDENGKELRYA